MRKLVAVLALFLTFSTVFTQQKITEKKEELKKLETELNESKQKLIETEILRKEKESSLNTSIKLKQETEQHVKELSKQERVNKDSLWVAHVRLLNAKRRINRNTDLLNSEFHYLYIEDVMSDVEPESMVDAFLLATATGITSNLIDETQNRKSSLQKTKAAKEDVYNQVFGAMKKAKRDELKVSKRVKNLVSEVKTLEQKKRTEEIKIKELEESLSQLQDLITKLEKEASKANRSYKFDKEHLSWPLKGKIIAEYGLQKNPLHGTTTLNNGIEIQAEVGSEVKAVAGGVVVFAEDYMRLGNVVVVDHKNGYMTVYSYNSSLLTQKGEELKEGDIVALSGEKPRSGEACLHFEIRKDGKPVDPFKFLDRKGVSF